MIRTSVQRFSEKIMLEQEAKARWRFNQIPSRFSAAKAGTSAASAGGAIALS
jgi:hypothetical protein